MGIVQSSNELMALGASCGRPDRICWPLGGCGDSLACCRDRCAWRCRLPERGSRKRRRMAMALTKEQTDKFADVGGIRLHYNEAGSGPALICTHGGGPGANAW